MLSISGVRSAWRPALANTLDVRQQSDAFAAWFNLGRLSGFDDDAHGGWTFKYMHKTPSRIAGAVHIQDRSTLTSIDLIGPDGDMGTLVGSQMEEARARGLRNFLRTEQNGAVLVFAEGRFTTR